MKNHILVLFVSVVFLAPHFLEARPGGGGGRGGGRPGGGGGHVGGGFKPNRPATPAARPPRPSAGPRPGTKPIANPGGGTVRPRPIGGGAGPGAIKPRPGTLPGKPGGKPGAGDVGKFLGGNPPGHFPGTPGHRPGYQYAHKAEFHTNINRHFAYHPSLGYPFGNAWFASYHRRYNHWPIWTVAATGIALARWVNINNYTGYGYATAVPYYPVEPAPAEAYQEMATEPAEVVATGKAVDVPDNSEWLNLGTFGLIPFQQKDIAYGVQLATTKEGIVRGIQWDMKTNETIEVEGSIEKDSLKIAWQSKDANAPYFETNTDELTQQESLINVYDPATKRLVSWQINQIEEKDLPPKN